MSAIFFLIFTLLSPGYSRSDEPAFPATCQQDCVTPFGNKLGATSDGVTAFSNCKARCVFPKPSMLGSDFAGIQWQCVEFARRWLMTEKGLTFGSIDVAADLWNKVDHLERLKTKESVPLRAIPNGAVDPPRPGDLLVYGREYLETGHVAVVLKVDRKKRLVFVGEENFTNASWPGNYARAIPYARHGKSYWLLDAYLLGWKAY